jgi:hypothetical protein
MLSALAEAGLGMQEVEHLWAVYERARAAEEKAGFNTGVHLCKGPRWDSLASTVIGLRLQGAGD